MNTVPTPNSLHGAAAPQVAPPASAPARAGWRGVLLVAAVLLLPLLVFFETAQSVVAIWERSGTYAHGYVIVPISLWLVWRQRAALQAVALRPCWLALPALAGCGAAWLLAELGDVQIVRQYALAAMLPLTVLTVLGWQLTRTLLFPLAFLLFAVPVGDSLIPPLIDITANFTIDALRLTGIPVLRDGNNFSIPSGNWSVVDACSGLRYLISSITLGCLFAYLTYRSAWRRALFVLASIGVPLLANGLRAYMIVMIGHLSGMKLAVGVDHLIYGWIFFGVVMLLLFWIGGLWREDGEAAPALAAVPSGTAVRAPRVAPLAGAAMAALLAMGMWPAYAGYLDHGAAAVHLAPLQSPSAPAAPFTTWQPDFAPAASVQRAFYATSGQPVGLHLLYYPSQPGGAKLISSANHVAREGDGDRWHERQTAVRSEQLAGRMLALRETVIVRDGARLLVWHWYAIGGQATASNYLGKWLQLKQKLASGSGAGTVVMVFAPYEDDPAPARAALRDFLQHNLVPLDAVLAAGSPTAFKP